MAFREFMMRWILPRDERILRDWLVAIELFNILVSFFMLVFLFLMLFATDLLWAVKFGVLLITFSIGLSTMNLMQYLLAVEFNTRKKDILKKRG